jgi:2-amino-4-hydroxy-6-hydroxymethyldihydropteridine diphosphokinase
MSGAPVVAYLALGSNVGAREAHLAGARAALAAWPGVRVTGASPVEETAPVGPVPQGPYLNQMLRVETTLAPEALLDAALALECAAGRDRAREVRWGPRTLDVDVVLYGDVTVATPRLTVPHPELPQRDFWQRELASLGVQADGPAEART